VYVPLCRPQPRCKQTWFNRHPQGKIDVGDKIGMLLDLTAGSLTFYRNGELYGPGFSSGVTGPVVRTVEMGSELTVVSLDVTATRPQ
jgi:hypothetical protein